MTTLQAGIKPYRQYQCESGKTVSYSQPYFFYSFVAVSTSLLNLTRTTSETLNSYLSTPREFTPEETDIANKILIDSIGETVYNLSPTSLSQLNIRRRTLCFVIGEDDSLILGATIPCTRDMFSKKLGRQISYGRINSFIKEFGPEFDSIDFNHVSYFTSIEELKEVCGGNIDVSNLFGPINVDYITKMVSKHIAKRSS